MTAGAHRIATGALIGVATLIVVAQWFLDAANSPQVGWDFPVFYIAGRIPLHDLYSRSAFAEYWGAYLAPIGVPHWAPYVRPAVFALPLRVFAGPDYWRAFQIWLTAGAAAYGLSAALALWRFRLPGFFLPAAAGFFPAVAGLISGADASFVLLGLVVAAIALQSKRDFWAGLALAACLCKFNLILLMPVLLLAHRRYRALLWFNGAAVAVAITSFMVSRPADYIRAVTEAQVKTAGFYPVGLRGFSSAIGQPWAYPVLAITVVIVFWIVCRRIALIESFAAAIVATLMISPYVTWYDSTLLLLPIAIVFSRSDFAVRVVCIGILVAVPMWRYGGGNNGPIGFTHIGVEALLLLWFAGRAGLRLPRLSPATKQMGAAS